MKFPKLLLLIGALLCTSISSKVWSQLNYLETSQGDNNVISLCSEETLTVTATAIGGSNSGFVFNRIRGGITQTIQFNSQDGDIVLYPLSAGESSNETYMDGDIFFAEIYDYTNAGTIALSPYFSDQFEILTLNLPSGANPYPGGTIASSNQFVCDGSLLNIISVTGGVTDTSLYGFQWESSIDNGATYSVIPGHTNTSLFYTDTITQTTLFRRGTTLLAGGTCIEYTNEHTASLVDLNPGTIATTVSSVCYNDQVSIINSSQNPQATTAGLISVDWEVSTDLSTWNSTGISTFNYQSTATLQTTQYYRRKATFTAGVSCDEYSNIVRIDVIPQVSAGTISSNQSLCNLTVPDPLTYSLPYDASLNYQWESSTDFINYSPIAGAVSATLDFNSNPSFLPLVTTHYRLRISETTSSLNCDSLTNSISIVVLPENVGFTNSAINDRICRNGEISFFAEGDADFVFLINGVEVPSTTATSLFLQDGLSSSSTVTLESNRNGCVEINSIFIEVFEISDADSNLRFDSGGTTFCGNAPLEFTATGTGTFTFFVNNVLYQAASSNPNFSIPSPSQNVTVTVLNELPTGCEKASSVALTYQDFDAGEIGGTSTNCVGATPLSINSVASATINNVPLIPGDFIYQWQSSTDGITYTDILLANNEAYTIANITQDTYVRRIVRNNFSTGVQCEFYSNEILLIPEDISLTTTAVNDRICRNGEIGFSAQGSGTFVFSINGLEVISTTATTLFLEDGLSNSSTITLESTRNGCVQTVSRFIEVFELSDADSNLTFDGGGTTFCGNNPLEFTASGTGSFTFFVNDILYQAASSNPNFSIPNPSQNVTVTVLNELPTGCEKTSSVALTYENVVPGIIGIDKSLCVGAVPVPINAVLSATINGVPLVPGNYVYQWQNSLDGTSYNNILSANSESYTVNTINQNTYYRRVVRKNSSSGGVQCEFFSNEILLVPDAVELTTDAVNDRVCRNGEISFFAQGNGTFVFSINGVAVTSTTSTSLFLQDGLSSSSTITLESTRNGCVQTVSKFIEVFELSAADSSLTFDAGGTTFCGNAPLEFTASGTGSFTFFVNDVLIRASSTDPKFSIPNPSQNVTVTVINESLLGCENATSIPLVFHDIYPGQINGNQTVCLGTDPIPLTSVASATINDVALVSGSYIYQWQSSFDGVTFTDILSANGASYAFPNVSQSTYFRRAVRSNTGGIQCELYSNQVFVEYATQLNQANNIQIDTSLCVGAVQLTYSGGEAPYVTRLYDLDNNLLFSGSTSSIQTLENLTPGQQYVAQISDASCFRAETTSFRVPIDLTLNPSRVSIISDNCFETPSDLPMGEILLQADAFSGGSNQFDFQWAGPNGFTASGLHLRNLSPGIYTLTVTDQILGCVHTETFTLNSVTALELTLSSGIQLNSQGEVELTCVDDSQKFLEVNISGGNGNYQFAWERDGIPLVGETTNRIEGITTGEYTVVVTNVPNNGLNTNSLCQISQSYTVISPAALIATVNQATATTNCTSNSYALGIDLKGGTPPYNISINNGVEQATTSNPYYEFTQLDSSILQGTNVTINVTDQNGCEAPQIQYTIPRTVLYSFSGEKQDIDCRNGTQGEIRLSSQPSVHSSDVLIIEWRSDAHHSFGTWSNGNNILTDITNPGTYTVSISTQEGCLLYNQNFEIEDLTGNQLSVEIVQEISSNACNENNGRIDLAISNGLPPYTIEWEIFDQANTWTSLPQLNNQAIVTGLVSGTYRAIVMDSTQNTSTTLDCPSFVITRAIPITDSQYSLVDFNVSTSSEGCVISEGGQIEFNIDGSFLNSSETTYQYLIDGIPVVESEDRFTIDPVTAVRTISNISAGIHRLSVIVSNGSSMCEIDQDFTIESEMSSNAITYSGPLSYELGFCDEVLSIELDPANIAGGVPYTSGLAYDVMWQYLPDSGANQVTQTFFGMSIQNADPGIYTLTITDANGCTNSTLTPIQIQVNAPEIAPFTVTGILEDPTGNSDALVKSIPQDCSNQGGAIGIEIEGGLRPFELNWYRLDPTLIAEGESTNNGFILIPEARNRNFLPNLDPGTYQYRITSLNEDCEGEGSIYSSISENISVAPNAELYIVSGPFIDSDLCENSPGRISVEIFNNGHGELFFFYNDEVIQEVINPQVNEQTHTLLIENPVENAVLKIVNAQGCVISKEINLSLGEPSFSFTSQSLETSNGILARETIEFENTSTSPYIRSEWLFGDFTAPVQISNVATASIVRYSYPVSGSYNVTLRLYNEIGCFKETSQMVSVGEGYSIILPNVFTPNNDGHNDLFRPLTTGLSKIDFSVYDNYGNLIYNEKAVEEDINALMGIEIRGWDGLNAPLTQSYFIYTVNGILNDGITEVEKTGTFIILK